MNREELDVALDRTAASGEWVAVINEASPDVIHVSTDLFHELVTQLGWRKVEPKRGGDIEYVKPRHEARQPHPSCMIGRP